MLSYNNKAILGHSSRWIITYKIGDKCYHKVGKWCSRGLASMKNAGAIIHPKIMSFEFCWNYLVGRWESWGSGSVPYISEGPHSLVMLLNLHHPRNSSLAVFWSLGVSVSPPTPQPAVIDSREESLASSRNLSLLHSPMSWQLPWLPFESFLTGFCPLGTPQMSSRLRRKWK